MVRDIQLRISLKEEEISDILLKKSAEFLSIPIADITGIKVLRKSIDARKPKIILNYKLSVFIKEALPSKPDYIFEEGNPAGIKSVLEYKGYCTPEVRLPLIKASAVLQAKIKDFMTSLS